MAQKAQYQTKQMTELLAYLETLQGSHVTVNDICAHFKQRGITIGTTTVYRHLERMVAEGIVAKYIVDGTTSACFEYLGDRQQCHKQACLHCKCEKCGKLIHIHCHEMANLGGHVLEYHGFEMDPLRTVFYGVCEECRKYSE